MNGKNVLVGNKALMIANNINVLKETETIVESIVLVSIDNAICRLCRHCR